MKDYFIDIDPVMSDFLTIFDIPFSNGFNNGDVSYPIEDYSGQEINPKEIYNTMVSSNFGVFGVTHTIPEFVQKMDIEVIEENGQHFIVFQLAPVLGLPNNNWEEELKELKTFLEWVKEEALKNPEHTVKLGFMRVGDKVDFNLISDSQILEKELNKKMDEKIAASCILTQWVANQKKGYREIEKQCYDLWISMSASALMSFEEQMSIIGKKPIKKQNAIFKPKRKNRF